MESHGSRRERVEELFEAAIELPADARASFLERACAGDERLREDVATLLRAHERAEGLLERGLRENAAALLDEATRGGAGARGGGVGGRPRDERIGPYRVLDEIGGTTSVVRQQVAVR